MSIDAAKARLERAREVQTATACSIDQALLILHHLEMENELGSLTESLEGLDLSMSAVLGEVQGALHRGVEEFSRETGNIAYMLRGIRDGLPETQ